MGDAEAHHAVWTVANVTPEREQQDIQELQDAIDFLDHAPAGFFSVDGSGQIGYVNATLAGWLDYQICTEVSSGGLTLADILSRRRRRAARPGRGVPAR